MRALLVIDMTNDFVHETFVHDGKEYKGKLVAPLAPTIIEPIKKRLERILPVSLQQVSYATKDHFNAFDDEHPRISSVLSSRRIDTIYIVGLVQEVCVYQNAKALKEQGFDVAIINGCTVPFDEEAGKKAFAELEELGVRFVDDANFRFVIFLNDSHDGKTEEISDNPDFVNTFPEHCMFATPGAQVIDELDIFFKDIKGLSVE